MKKTEKLSIIEKCIINQKTINIVLKDIDEGNVNCLPIKTSENLLLINELVDYQLNSLQVIMIKNIKKINLGDVEDFTTLILGKENIINEFQKIISAYSSISLNTWKEFFSTCNLQTYFLITFEDNDFIYYRLGQILKIYQNYIEFRYFDKLGKWNKEVLKIKFSSITSVEFGGNYINTIIKYLDNSSWS